jgi:hypothetical protein
MTEVINFHFSFDILLRQFMFVKNCTGRENSLIQIIHNPVFSVRTTRFNTKNMEFFSHVTRTWYVIRMIPKTKNSYFNMQQWSIGNQNGSSVCSLWGGSWLILCL